MDNSVTSSNIDNSVPNVPKEHLDSMKMYYWTIGDMSKKEFIKMIRFDKIEDEFYIKSYDILEKPVITREWCNIDIWKEYELYIHILSRCIIFKTKNNSITVNIKEYLAQNDIDPEKFKESVINALYINFKTPFMVDRVKDTTDKVKDEVNLALKS